MIGDDDFHFQLIRALYRLDIRYAAIQRNNQIDFFLGQFVYRGQVQAEPFIMPMRNM